MNDPCRYSESGRHEIDSAYIEHDPGDEVNRDQNGTIQIGVLCRYCGMDGSTMLQPDDINWSGEEHRGIVLAHQEGAGQ